MAHWYDADTLTASPSQFNFLIFTGVWGFRHTVRREEEHSGRGEELQYAQRVEECAAHGRGGGVVV